MAPRPGRPKRTLGAGQSLPFLAVLGVSVNLITPTSLIIPNLIRPGSAYSLPKLQCRGFRPDISTTVDDYNSNTGSSIASTDGEVPVSNPTVAQVIGANVDDVNNNLNAYNITPPNFFDLSAVDYQNLANNSMLTNGLDLQLPIGMACGLSICNNQTTPDDPGSKCLSVKTETYVTLGDDGSSLDVHMDAGMEMNFESVEMNTCMSHTGAVSIAGCYLWVLGVSLLQSTFDFGGAVDDSGMVDLKLNPLQFRVGNLTGGGLPSMFKMPSLRFGEQREVCLKQLLSSGADQIAPHVRSKAGVLALQFALRNLGTDLCFRLKLQRPGIDFAANTMSFDKHLDRAGLLKLDMYGEFFNPSLQLSLGEPVGGLVELLQETPLSPLANAFASLNTNSTWISANNYLRGILPTLGTAISGDWELGSIPILGLDMKQVALGGVNNVQTLYENNVYTGPNVRIMKLVATHGSLLAGQVADLATKYVYTKIDRYSMASSSFISEASTQFTKLIPSLGNIPVTCGVSGGDGVGSSTLPKQITCGARFGQNGNGILNIPFHGVGKLEVNYGSDGRTLVLSGGIQASLGPIGSSSGLFSNAILGNKELLALFGFDDAATLWPLYFPDMDFKIFSMKLTPGPANIRKCVSDAIIGAGAKMWSDHRLVILKMLLQAAQADICIDIKGLDFSNGLTLSSLDIDLETTSLVGNYCSLINLVSQIQPKLAAIISGFFSCRRRTSADAGSDFSESNFEDERNRLALSEEALRRLGALTALDLDAGAAVGKLMATTVKGENESGETVLDRIDTRELVRVLRGRDGNGSGNSVEVGADGEVVTKEDGEVEQEKVMMRPLAVNAVTNRRRLTQDNVEFSVSSDGDTRKRQLSTSNTLSISLADILGNYTETTGANNATASACFTDGKINLGSIPPSAISGSQGYSGPDCTPTTTTTTTTQTPTTSTTTETPTASSVVPAMQLVTSEVKIQLDIGANVTGADLKADTSFTGPFKASVAESVGVNTDKVIINAVSVTEARRLSEVSAEKSSNIEKSYSEAATSLNASLRRLAAKDVTVDYSVKVLATQTSAVIAKVSSGGASASAFKADMTSKLSTKLDTNTYGTPTVEVTGTATTADLDNSGNVVLSDSPLGDPDSAEFNSTMELILPLLGGFVGLGMLKLFHSHCLKGKGNAKDVDDLPLSPVVPSSPEKMCSNEEDAVDPRLMSPTRMERGEM